MYSRGRQTKRSLFEKVLLQKNVHRNTKLFTKHASYMFLKRGQKGVPFTAIKIFELFKKGETVQNCVVQSLSCEKYIF